MKTRAQEIARVMVAFAVCLAIGVGVQHMLRSRTTVNVNTSIVPNRTLPCVVTTGK